MKKLVAAALTTLLLVIGGCGEPDRDDVADRPAHGEPGHNHPEDHHQ